MYGKWVVADQIKCTVDSFWCKPLKEKKLNAVDSFSDIVDQIQNPQWKHKKKWRPNELLLGSNPSKKITDEEKFLLLMY